MRTVPVAELKNQLSAYLRLVQTGKEIVIRDRNTPIAKIVPFAEGDVAEEERWLVGQGLLKLPAKPFRPEVFFPGEKNVKVSRVTKSGLDAALDWSRQDTTGEDLHVSILGRKRRAALVRARTKK